MVFPEGVISRTNDRLNNLMDGVAFMARSAAKERPVVIHPIALRYFFRGEFAAAKWNRCWRPLERRLSWPPQSALPVRERIVKIEALAFARASKKSNGSAKRNKGNCNRLEKLYRLFIGSPGTRNCWIARQT